MERETAPRDWLVVRRGTETVMISPTPRSTAMLAAVAWCVTIAMARGHWVLGLLSGAGAAWLTLVRREWVLGPSGLTLRLRLGPYRVREHVFTQGRLDVEHRVDSDGDHTWALVVRAGARRRVLSRALHDPGDLLAFGEWIGARTGLPFDRPSR